MRDQRQRLGGIAVLAIVALLVIFGLSYSASRLALSGFSLGQVTGGEAGGMMGNSATGMMGSGSMMGTRSSMGGPSQSADPAAVRARSADLAAAASINRHADTINYHVKRVQLVALASPEGEPDMTWNIDGLVNPTVVVPKNAHVTVDFFNADTNHQHGWELTRQPPPYQYMAMMYAAVIQPGAFAMPVGAATASRWVGRTLHFTVSTAGAYYYLCPVPGHAQKGMYGKLVVR